MNRQGILDYPRSFAYWTYDNLPTYLTVEGAYLEFIFNVYFPTYSIELIIITKNM